MYLSPGKIWPSLSRLRFDSIECNLTDIRQWPDSEPTLTELIRSKTVGKLRMIRYCRNGILSRSALSHCKRLCLVSVVLYSVIVGTLISLTNFVFITGLFRNGFGKNGSKSTRSGWNLDSIGRKTTMKNFSRSLPFNRTPSKIHKTLLGFWSDTAESVTT